MDGYHRWSVRSFLPWSRAGPAGRRVHSAGSRSLRAALRAVLAPRPGRRPRTSRAGSSKQEPSWGAVPFSPGRVLVERHSVKAKPLRGRCASLDPAPPDQRHSRLREGRRGVATVRGWSSARLADAGGHVEHQDQPDVPGPAVLADVVDVRVAGEDRPGRRVLCGLRLARSATAPDRDGPTLLALRRGRAGRSAAGAAYRRGRGRRDGGHVGGAAASRPIAGGPCQDGRRGRARRIVGGRPCPGETCRRCER
jgi:hypothetical protein